MSNAEHGEFRLMDKVRLRAPFGKSVPVVGPDRDYILVDAGTRAVIISVPTDDPDELDWYKLDILEGSQRGLHIFAIASAIQPDDRPVPSPRRSDKVSLPPGWGIVDSTG